MRDIKLETGVFSPSVQHSHVFYGVVEVCPLFSWTPDEEAGQLLEAVFYENSRYLSTGLMLGAQRHSGAEAYWMNPRSMLGEEWQVKACLALSFIYPIFFLIIMLWLLFYSAGRLSLNLYNIIVYIIELPYSGIFFLKRLAFQCESYTLLAIETGL